MRAVVMACCVAVAWMPAPARAAGDDADSSLAASTAPAWTPPAPVQASEPWETALRLPLRVATFPLSLLGDAVENGMRFFEEKRPAGKAGIKTPGAGYGVSVMPANLGDRTGFGGAVQYRPPFLGGVLGAKTSGSTRAYNRTDLDLTAGPIQLAYRYDWRPQERFFDIGMSTSHDLPSTYTVRRQYARLALQFPAPRRGETAPRGSSVQVWAGPRESILRQGRGDPASFDVRFPAYAYQRDLRSEYFAYGGRATFDKRSGTPHWTRGFRVAGQADRFDRSIEALAIRNAHTGAPLFTRWTAEGETGTSFMRDPHTVRLAMRAVTHSGDLTARPLLLSDLMTLGGHEGLSGFEPGRFRDNDLVVGKLSYIFPLMTNVELDLHAETGGVYPRLQDASLHSFRNSYGFALRARDSRSILGSVGVDWSNESVRLIYLLRGVE